MTPFLQSRVKFVFFLIYKKINENKFTLYMHKIKGN